MGLSVLSNAFSASLSKTNESSRGFSSWTLALFRKPKSRSRPDTSSKAWGAGDFLLGALESIEAAASPKEFAMVRILIMSSEQTLHLMAWTEPESFTLGSIFVGNVRARTRNSKLISSSNFERKDCVTACLQSSCLTKSSWIFLTPIWKDCW